MRAYKLVLYSGNGEYETYEKYLSENTFRKMQKALAEGSDLIILKDRIIRRSQIKEVMPADSDVAEYMQQLNLSQKEVMEDILKLDLSEEKSLGSGDNKNKKDGFEKISSDDYKLNG